MHLLKLILLSLLLIQIEIVNCARILFVTTTPALSHNLFYQPIIKELSLRGHQVVSITSDPINDSKLTNLTEINVHNETYTAFVTVNFLKDFQLQITPTNIIRRAFPGFVRSVDQSLNNSEVRKLIQNDTEHFDLFISETTWGSAVYGFVERFQCPFIGLVSLELALNNMDAIGNPPNPSYHVDFWKMTAITFWQKLDNFIHSLQYRWFYFMEFLPEQNKILKKHFGAYNRVLDIWQLEKNVDLILSNTNPIFHAARPLMPNVIRIGGLLAHTPRGISDDLKQFLDDAKEGVIYLSMGGNIKTTTSTNKLMTTILNTFKELPFKILWKMEKDELISDKILTQKWVPQQIVLGHPNVKLFITQGGTQSTEESIKNKVPMLGIPVGGDQPYYTRRVAMLGIGQQLQLKDLTKDNFRKAILELINNPEYKKRIEKISDLIWDQETKPLDRAIWWIEYIIRHGGGQHLRSPAVDLSWFQFLLLDVIGFLLVCFLIAITIIFNILRLIYRLFFISKQKRE